MDWLEITVVVDAEAAEAAAEVFSRYAPDGVAIEQRARTDSPPKPDWSTDGPLEPTVSVRAYLPMDAEVEAKRQQISEALWHLRQIVPFPEPVFNIIKPEDWENAWKEHYHVIRLGERFVLKPSWREYEPQPDDVILELDPGMAFGTGLHPTTQLCLHAIEQHMPTGARVLDLGTGSGILAIAAAKLGAGSVLGLDVDTVAIQAARENVARNQVGGSVRIEAGSLDAIGSQVFDFALVNILAKVIIELCEAGLAEKINPGGVVTFAGLIDTQESEVQETLTRVGLSLIERMQDKDWVGLVCRREPGVTR